MTTRLGKKKRFTASMKLADVIDTNFNLITILSRMGIGFGFGNDTIEEVCKKYGINANAFLLVCNVYTFENYLPSKEILNDADLRDIVSYLNNSHKYYMDVAVSYLAEGLENVIKFCDERSQKMIWKFFTQYKEELTKHFEYEEKIVFPYMLSVLNHNIDSNYTILQYEENHTNVDEKIEDLKNIVMKYLPAGCDTQLVIKVLTGLYSLELDLRKHTAIEDDILVPIINRMEENEE